MIHVVLYEPEIPGNTGNIIRTCMATNSRLHLIEPLGFSLDEKHLRRSGMDYIKEADIHIHKNWEAFLAENPGASMYFMTRYGKKRHPNLIFPRSRETFILCWARKAPGSTNISCRIISRRACVCRCVRMPDRLICPTARRSLCMKCFASLAIRN